MRAEVGEQLARARIHELTEGAAAVADVAGVEQGRVAVGAGTEPETPGRQAERHAQQQTQGARPERLDRRKRVVQHQHHPNRAQRGWRQHGGVAHQEPEPVLDRLADAATGSAEVEHERQERRECHEREPDQIAVMLLQHRQAEPNPGPGLAAALSLRSASGLAACHC